MMSPRIYGGYSVDLWPDTFIFDSYKFLSLGLHNICVAIFFTLGAYLVFVSFRKTSLANEIRRKPIIVGKATDLEDHSDAKKLRNRIYVWCAALMLVGMVLFLSSPAVAKKLGTTIEAKRIAGEWRFATESLAIFSFAFAWLVKGQSVPFLKKWIADSSPSPNSHQLHRLSFLRNKAFSSLNKQKYFSYVLTSSSYPIT